jgi:hypothetical protein
MELRASEGHAQHSVFTAILINDHFPLKAALQPWNHLCVKEYVAEMQSSDVCMVNRDCHGYDKPLG